MNVGVAVAVAAAVAREQMQRQEEEEMTPYSAQDLADGWEFKILRATTGMFRDSRKLQAVLDEERRGGWVLVEKFDNSRIRLKRPAGTKVVQGDFDDPYDPYRVTVGVSQGLISTVAIGLLLLIMFAGMAVTHLGR